MEQVSNSPIFKRHEETRPLCERGLTRHVSCCFGSRAPSLCPVSRSVSPSCCPALRLVMLRVLLQCVITLPFVFSKYRALHSAPPDLIVHVLSQTSRSVASPSVSSTSPLLLSPLCLNLHVAVGLVRVLCVLVQVSLLCVLLKVSCSVVLCRSRPLFYCRSHALCVLL